MLFLAVESSPNVKTIELVFPVTGHSFIPPDRVFGNIEKKIRKGEVITTPDEYLDIISESATVPTWLGLSSLRLEISQRAGTEVTWELAFSDKAL